MFVFIAKVEYEQMCSFVKWPGIMTNGGFAEYVLVDSYRFLVKVKVELQERENNNNDKKNDGNNNGRIRRNCSSYRCWINTI